MSGIINRTQHVIQSSLTERIFAAYVRLSQTDNNTDLSRPQE